MRQYKVCPDCGWQWWIDATCSTSSLHKCKNGNMVVYPEPSPQTNAHVNPVFRTILNNFFKGIYSQEETINLIVKEIGYDKVSISGGSTYKDGTDLQTMQSPDKNGKG
jgi:hypothetical protein